jgi:hypothetical protein
MVRKRRQRKAMNTRRLWVYGKKGNDNWNDKWNVRSVELGDLVEDFGVKLW